MQKPKVFQHKLNNGLNILVVEKHNVPKVSIQLWYNVGSKDEKSGEKGIAHFIEHMIFKGTEKLSESDINMITHKLSGVCNAFTSYDYTGYLFDFPSQNWHESLPIMADCMRNCTFKQELLNSEVKAVIQELKMRKDSYQLVVIQQLLSAIFADHPYHHPIIGYKQDLWSMERDALINFYNKHYWPNNATLVVVGDVEHQEVFERAQENFGKIESNPTYVKEQFYHSSDLSSKSVTIYREVQQPLVTLVWQIPGARKKQSYIWNVISLILAQGDGSRLYKKLVDELNLVVDIECSTWELFDHSLFLLSFQPFEQNNIEKIIEIINQEIKDISKNGISEAELIRANKKTEVDYLPMLESNHQQCNLLGEIFLATGDADYLYNYLDEINDPENINKVKDNISKFLRPSVMHRGIVLPIEQEEKENLLKIQETSDEEDTEFLTGKAREIEVEQGVQVLSIKTNSIKPFNFPAGKAVVLKNGLKLLYHDNNALSKIDIILDFKTKTYYDPQDKQGILNLVSDLLLEGTDRYSASDLATELESNGINLQTAPGLIQISLLSKDLEKGLDILADILINSKFSKKSIEKIKSQTISDIKNFWDNPNDFIGQILKEKIYKNHPFSKNSLGSEEFIKEVTQEDLISYYKKAISPIGARMSIVGDISNYDIEKIVESSLSGWIGKEIIEPEFPEIESIKSAEFNHYINRDQTVLVYGGISVKRLDPDFDKLFLFDQIFTGGILGSMSSKLFELRERSGLFYTIGGSLIARSDKQPGMVFIKTIVSNDRLKEAENAIAYTINNACEIISLEEFEDAKNAVINSLSDNFSSNNKTALTLLFLDNYNFSSEYFINRPEQIKSITIEQVKEAVSKYLNTTKMVKVRAGRV